jgi:hypothetical protein
MIPLQLWYSLDQTEGDVAREHEDLDAALDRVAAISDSEWAALAEVTQHADKFAAMLYVGFRTDMGALMYPGDQDHEETYTRGAGAPNHEPILYMQCNSDNEFPSNSEVPAALIRQAVHEFADTGLRPTCVEWQTWNPVAVDSGSENGFG